MNRGWSKTIKTKGLRPNLMVNRNELKMKTWKGLGSLIQCKLWLGPKPLSLNKRLDLMYSKLIEKGK